MRSRDDICRELAAMRGLEYHDGQFFGFTMANGQRNLRLPVSTRLANDLERQVEHLVREEQAAEQATADARQAAHERIAAQTGYRFDGYYNDGTARWLAGNRRENATRPDPLSGRLRTSTTVVTHQERESLNRQVEAELTPDGDEPDSLRDRIAAALGQVRPHARRAGGLLAGIIGRMGGRFGGLVSSMAGGAGIGGMAFGLNSLVGTAGNLVSGATGQVATVTSTLLSHALSAAGQSGQGATEIGSALVTLTARGVSSAAGLAVTVGTAIIGALAAGLTMTLNIAGLALGGLLLAVFVGALGMVGAALGKSVGEVFGAAADAVVKSFQAVVKVLQDLVQAGREFAAAGTSMVQLGGQSPSQATGWLTNLMGFGMRPQQVGSIFGQWAMRPEFLGPRMGLLGVAPGSDPTLAMLTLSDTLKRLPDLLRFPMLSIAMGGTGNASALMPVLMQPRANLLRNAAMMSSLGVDQGLILRVNQRLEPILNLFLGLLQSVKLNVLDRLLPLMEAGLSILLGLWQRHLGQVRGLIDRLPEYIGIALQWLVRAAQFLLEWFVRVYDWGRGFVTWAKGDLVPVLETFWSVLRKIAAFLKGLARDFGGGDGSGRSQAATGSGPTPRGTGSRRARGQHASSDPWRRAGRRTRETAHWATQHPWLAAGLGVAGLGAASGARAGLGWMATHPRAVWNAGRTGLSALRWGTGALRALAVDAFPALGAPVAGLSAGTVALPAAAAAVGGYEVGRLIRAPIYRTGVLGPAIREAQNLWDRSGATDRETEAMRRGGLDALRDAEGLTPRQRLVRDQQLAAQRDATDPVHRWTADQQRRMAEWYQTVSPENLRRLVAEAMSQKLEVTVKNEGQIKVLPSDEFAARMEFLESEQSFRAVQLAVS